MQIFLGADHGGFELKEAVKKGLSGKHKLKDFGTHSSEGCDYPDFALKVAKAVAESKGKAMGLLFCGTGIGMCMVANKVAGIRAAVVWDDYSAKMAREHNNANVICLGGRVLEKEAGLKLVEVFLKGEFEKGRHERRVGKIDEVDDEQARPLPVVGALIFNEKDEIFLMKSPKWDGLYIVPGGHIELGETRLETLKREVKEETGLDIYDEKLFTLHDAVFPEKYYKKRHFVMIDYLAKAKPGKVKLDMREGTEFVWMKPKLALKELKMDQYTRKALEDYVNIMDLAKVV